jgi:hypothetical protein
LHEKGRGETSELLEFWIWSSSCDVHPGKGRSIIGEEVNNVACRAEIAKADDLQCQPEIDDDG